MKKIVILIMLFGIFAIGHLSLVTSAFAQNSSLLNLTVTPSVLDLTSNPGSTIQEKIRVKNNTNNPINLTLKTSKLSTDEKGNIVPVDSHDSYLSWISYSPSTFSAKPNEWTDITVQIKIPTSAAFGYYYAINISPTNNQTKNKNNGSTLIGQALIPVLLNVQKAGANANISLISFTPSQKIYQYLPTTFNITFINRGNIHIRPQGNVFIHTDSNSDVAVLDFNQADGAMLPGERRTYTASWDDGFLVQEPIITDGSIVRDENGNPKTHLVIQWNKLTSFRIGKYTAQLLAVYDNGKRDVPIESTTIFWVFPYTFIGIALISLIIVVVLFRIIIKWYINKEVKKHTK